MSTWTYKCVACGLAFSLERPRALRRTKARCNCGGDASFTKVNQPAGRMEAPFEGLGPAAIVLDTCTDVYVGNVNVAGHETVLAIKDSDVTVRGGVWRTQVGIESHGTSTLDVADLVHRPPPAQ